MRKPVGKTPSRSYTVGRGRPPRWRPGQSGNPKGRPKNARNISVVLSDLLRQKVTVTEDGKTHRVPVLEAMLRQLANDALRSVPSAKLLLSIIERHAASPAAEHRPEELSPEDQAILARYLGTPSGPDADETRNADEEHGDDQ